MCSGRQFGRYGPAGRLRCVHAGVASICIMHCMRTQTEFDCWAQTRQRMLSKPCVCNSCMRNAPFMCSLGVQEPFPLVRTSKLMCACSQSTCTWPQPHPASRTQLQRTHLRGRGQGQGGSGRARSHCHGSRGLLIRPERQRVPLGHLLRLLLHNFLHGVKEAPPSFLRLLLHNFLNKVTGAPPPSLCLLLHDLLHGVKEAPPAGPCLRRTC